MEQKLQQRKSWRKLVKKKQRKRRRQKLAQARDNELEDDELNKLKDPIYKSWVENQHELASLKLLAEKIERDEQEEQWLRRELIAQKQFRKDEQKRKEQESEKEAERLKQEEELMKLQKAKQKKQDELRKQAEETAKEFEDILNSMQEYLDNSEMKTPQHLENHVESRPGEKLCEFYEKTNCCRFGPGCTFNHKRPMLAKIIVIRHFFHHPLLEQHEHEEYARGDPNLELNEQDLRESYDEFCKDVWPELESFGKILNFRTVRNVHLHLRGHVFVEFAEKRYALKAFTKLQNRYYASKRLNVEFSNIHFWRSGVCGMRSFFKGLSLGRRCPKGPLCNFLHLMKNPKNKYNAPMDSPARTPQSNYQSSKTRMETPLISWNNLDVVEGKNTKHRNWRWSESPEMELKSNNADETSVEYSPKNTSIQKRSETINNSKEKSPNLKHRQHRTKSSSREKQKFNSNYGQSQRLPSPSFNYESKRHQANENSSSEEKQSPAKTKEKNGNSKQHRSRRSKSPSKDFYKTRDTNPRLSHHKMRRHKSKSPSNKYKSKHKKSKRH